MSDDTTSNPDPTPEEPSSDKSDHTSSRSLPLLIGIGVLILLLLLLIIWFLFLRDTRPDVWEDATVPYTAEQCAEEGACEEINITAAGHGAHGEESGTRFVYDPSIDDEIAQWGDCLDQMMVCMQTGMAEEGANGPDVIRGCVAAADSCPGECRERFAGRAAGLDLAALEELYFSTFVDERGYCVPREADQ